MADKKKRRRRRTKRLLMLAALAGGAALMGRGKKKFGTDAGFLKSGAAGGASLSSPPIGGTDHIKKVVAANAAANAAENTGRIFEGNTRLKRGGVGPMESVIAKQKIPGYGTAVAPPGILNPYNPRTHTMRGMNRAKGGRIGAKKGGSVTGIAKRGFGRALMKGKK
jgi:hypothetical protein